MHSTNVDPRVLQKIKNKVLVAYRSDLCKKLAPEKYYAVLRQIGVFSVDDEQEVRSKVTRTDKVSLLLDKLELRDDAYDILTKALKENETEEHVLQFLEKALHRLLETEVSKYHGKVISCAETSGQDDIQDLPLPP